MSRRVLADYVLLVLVVAAVIIGAPWLGASFALWMVP